MNIAEITSEERKAKALDREPLDLMDPDPCCFKRFGANLKSHSLKFASAWFCPKCGTEFRPVMVGTVRHWVAHIYVSLVNKR